VRWREDDTSVTIEIRPNKSRNTVKYSMILYSIVLQHSFLLCFEVSVGRNTFDVKGDLHLEYIETESWPSLPTFASNIFEMKSPS
jgi:hypothetical protein